jgi:hypothetical protein
MCDLELRALVADHRVVFTPIELKCLAWAERQWNEYASARRLLLTLPIISPLAGEGGDPIIRARKAESHQI